MLAQYYVKRLFDFAVTSIGIVLLLPLFVTIALAIKFTSKGPVLYRQTRIGKNGKPFEFYKFRSMYMGSDKDHRRKDKIAKFIKQGASTSGSTKIVDEQNITKVGRFLRKMSFDELPQLFNVLKGEMSFVGPRPCLPYEWEHYENWHKRRLSVIPGCTGLWQVNGRSEVGFDDMVILDLYYIGNRSFVLDLQIILKTIPVFARREGCRTGERRRDDYTCEPRFLTLAQGVVSIRS